MLFLCSKKDLPVLTEKETTRISKFLSLVLRHQPEIVNLQLDENGWASVDDLLQKIKAKGFGLDKAGLRHVVDTNNKKRFAFNEDGTKIRASQGHSVAVNLGYEAMTPPPVLYHGTAQQNIASIIEHGLQKKSRQHVRLECR